MKKSVTLALLFAGAFTSAAYAQGNLFTPADCDSNGWLWFCLLYTSDAADE